MPQIALPAIPLNASSAHDGEAREARADPMRLLVEADRVTCGAYLPGDALEVGQFATVVLADLLVDEGVELRVHRHHELGIRLSGSSLQARRAEETNVVTGERRAASCPVVGRRDGLCRQNVGRIAESNSTCAELTLEMALNREIVGGGGRSRTGDGGLADVRWPCAEIVN